MDKINKLFYLAFSAILFCIGLFILINESRTYQNSLRILKKRYKEDVIYQQYYPKDSNIVSYAELIASLMYTLDMDIRINNIVIRANEHVAGKIDSYGIIDNEYIKSYSYDDEGNITMIIYRSVAGS